MPSCGGMAKCACMNIRKGYIALGVTALLAGGAFLLWQSQDRSPATLLTTAQPLDYTSHTLRLKPHIAKDESVSRAYAVAAVSSHHLPTAEPFIEEMYFQLSQRRPDIADFVIVGPDHFERCKNVASVTTRDFLTPYGIIENSHEISTALKEAGAGEDNSCFENEHAIGVQTTFIKKYFPKARVTSMLFSSATAPAIPEKLAFSLYKLFPEAVAVGSIDFSHYENVEAANTIDEISERQIKTMDTETIQLRQMDSPSSLRFVVGFAKLHGGSLGFFDHTNSFNLTGQAENTTSYFNAVFQKE